MSPTRTHPAESDVMPITTEPVAPPAPVLTTIDLTSPITDSVEVRIGGGQVAILDRGPDCPHCHIHAVHTAGGWVAGDAKNATTHRCMKMAEAELATANAQVAAVRELVKGRDRLPLGQFIALADKVAAAVGG